MKKYTESVVDWMIQFNVINKKDKELYTYALHSFVLMLLPFILAGFIGFCMGNVKHGFVLILPFIVLRKYSGGYHAKSLHICILGSGFLLILCTIISRHVQCDWKLVITTVIASVSLIVFSPIESENRKIDTYEKRVYKKITAICVILFGMLEISLFLLEKYIYTKLFSVGIIMTACLQMPCIVKMCKSTKNRH